MVLPALCGSCEIRGICHEAQRCHARERCLYYRGELPPGYALIGSFRESASIHRFRRQKWRHYAGYVLDIDGKRHWIPPWMIQDYAPTEEEKMDTVSEVKESRVKYE